MSEVEAYQKNLLIRVDAWINRLPTEQEEFRMTNEQWNMLEFSLKFFRYMITESKEDKEELEKVRLIKID
jgi:hypothetical protein